MKGKIYYKTFKTPEACYVYDRRSNKILKITDEIYEKLAYCEAKRSGLRSKTAAFCF